MGGCVGKNKFKTPKHKSNSTNEPDSRNKDENEVSDSSPSSSQSLPSSTGFTVNHDEDTIIVTNKQISIDSDIELIMNEHDGISALLRRPVPHTVVSVTDSELATELAYLVYGHPEKEYTENLPIIMPFKTTEA